MNTHPVTPHSPRAGDHGPQGDNGSASLVKRTYGGSARERIAERRRERLARAVPENTAAAYEQAWTTFESWCVKHGLATLPAEADTLTDYVTVLADDGRAPATISQHIGAIRTAHRRAGFGGQPIADDALIVLRGYRRDLAEEGIGQRQAIPVTAETLGRMVGTLDLSTVAGRRDQLALVLGFCGMLRRSELVRLRTGDVTVTSDGVTVLVRTSKTDKESKGRTVPLPPQSRPELCPVAVTERWLLLLGDAEGHLLRRVTRGDELTSLPWRAAGVNDLVKRCARDAGLPSKERYSAHSLRAGGLTASLRHGTPAGVAARHGGWTPESPMVARYARVADLWKDNAMRGVL